MEQHIHVWYKFNEKKSVAGANLGVWECTCGEAKEGYQVWGQEPQGYDNLDDNKGDNFKKCYNMAPVYN